MLGQNFIFDINDDADQENQCEKNLQSEIKPKDEKLVL